MPKVFQHASNYFSRLTLGRYRQLVLLEESNWIQVEDREGFFYTVDELSQGTKDQLYIAIRLALSNVMAKDLSLPFFNRRWFCPLRSIQKGVHFRNITRIK